MYARVPHSESSIFVGVLASTSFALYNNRLATMVLIYLCLQNKYITSVIVIIYYIPIKLYKTSGCLHLFKITGTLTSEDIKLNKNYSWDTLEINLDKIKLSFNSNEIELPKLVIIKIQDEIRIRRMMSREM